MLRLLPRDARRREAACAVGAREFTVRKSILLSVVKVSNHANSEKKTNSQRTAGEKRPKVFVEFGAEKISSNLHESVPGIRNPTTGQPTPAPAQSDRLHVFTPSVFQLELALHDH